MKTEKRLFLPLWAVAAIAICCFLSCCFGGMLFLSKDLIASSTDAQKAKEDAHRAGLPVSADDLSKVPTADQNMAIDLRSSYRKIENIKKGLSQQESEMLRQAGLGLIQDPDRLNATLAKFDPAIAELKIGLAKPICDPSAGPEQAWFHDVLAANVDLLQARAALGAALGKAEAITDAASAFGKIQAALTRSDRGVIHTPFILEASGELGLRSAKLAVDPAPLTSLTTSLKTLPTPPNLNAFFRPWLVETLMAYERYGNCVMPEKLDANRRRPLEMICEISKESARQVFDTHSATLLGGAREYRLQIQSADTFDKAEEVLLNPMRKINGSTSATVSMIQGYYDQTEDWATLMDRIGALRHAEAKRRMAICVLYLKRLMLERKPVPAILPDDLGEMRTNPVTNSPFKYELAEKGFRISSPARSNSRHPDRALEEFSYAEGTS